MVGYFWFSLQEGLEELRRTNPKPGDLGFSSKRLEEAERKRRAVEGQREVPLCWEGGNKGKEVLR